MTTTATGPRPQQKTTDDKEVYDAEIIDDESEWEARQSKVRAQLHNSENAARAHEEWIRRARLWASQPWGGTTDSRMVRKLLSEDILAAQRLTKSIMAPDKSGANRLDSVMSKHDMYQNHMLMAMMSCLTHGMGGRTLIGAIGSMAAMTLFSPQARQMLGSSFSMVTNTLNDLFAGNALEKVDGDLTRLSKKERARYDAMITRQRGHAPFTAESAGRVLFAQSVNTYQRMRDPGADIVAIQAEHNKVIAGIYRYCTEDGLDRDDVDHWLRITATEQMTADPSLRTVFPRFAHAGLAAARPQALIRRIPGLFEQGHLWTGDQIGVTGSIQDSDGVSRLLVSPREPMDTEQHAIENSRTISEALISHLNYDDWGGFNTRLQGYLAAMGAPGPMAGIDLGSIPVLARRSLEEVEVMRASMTGDGMQLWDQRRAHSAAITAAINRAIQLHPQLQGQLAVAYGPEWKKKVSTAAMDPQAFLASQARSPQHGWAREQGVGFPPEYGQADDTKQEKLQREIDTLTGLRAQAAEAPSLDSFAAGDEQLEEWLTVSQQYLYLSDLTLRGAKARYGETLDDKVVERLRYELRTIEWMGFPGYFLIVSDFIAAARNMGVSVGPGRGSAAGSVVAYCLKITNIDPLKYDLLFERFLNPDRISLPDVDVDFDEDGRGEVLKYVTEKYGKTRVAQIVTFGTMAPKMAIRDVARVQKLPLPESDRLAKLVPDKLIPDKGETPFERAYKDVPELAGERNSPNILVQNTLKYAEKLEGSVRQTGVHACGVIIGKDDLELYVPLATVKDKEQDKESKEENYINIVQYEGTLVESIGLIKMDFLGLKTLSIIKDAVANIKRVKGIDIDIDAIPLDDALTYTLFSRGETTGIFQFESPGMKKYLRALKPNRFEDLIAMNALYRPGPMDKIPNFIARKHGQERVEYEFPEMEEYLADTYGITVYQEQVMLLSQKLAGFSGGEADALRKAMGKKIRAALDKMKPKFIKGATERGHDAAVCEKIWTEWEAFASYAFNKSHSTCYAYVAYQTAYLKAHYPSEFMAAILSRNLSNMDKLSFFMDECKRMGINVLGPDINESVESFTSDAAGNVRFGLAAVKGVGKTAMTSIVEEREKNGRFTNMYDFVERTNMQAVNKKNIENMALAGALDSINDFHRSKLFSADKRDASGALFIDQLLRYGSRMQSEKNAPQQSLFGGADHIDIQKPLLPQCDEWSKLETLNHEREMIGMYLSSHPLDDYAVVIKHFCNTQLTQFANLNDLRDKDFLVAGMVVGVQNLYTKNGKPFGRFKLEDYSGQHEFTLFDKDYERFRQYLFQDYFIMVKGSVKPKLYNKDEYEAKISAIQQLSDAYSTLLNDITLSIYIDDISQEMIARLKERLSLPGGNVNLKVKIIDSREGVVLNFFSKKYRVNLTMDLVEFLENMQINYRIA